MEPEYRYLLSILRAFILEQEPGADPGVDWDKLFELAHIHSVPGILGYMSMKYPVCPDPVMKNRLRQSCLASMSLFAQKASNAESLFALFAEHKIRYCTMKGIHVRSMYPVAELRSFSDVDFLIHKEDRQRSHKLMLSNGFRVKNDWEPVYSYFKDKEFYEIHTQIMEIDLSDKADYKGFFSLAWEHAVQTEECGYRLAPEFHFLYLLTHIAKHVQGSGAGIRMYLDIAAFLRYYTDSVDWSYIAKMLRLLALWDFARTVLNAVQLWFGVTCPMEYEPVSQNILDRFEEFTMEAGVFGRYQRDVALSTLKKQSGSRFSVLMEKLFPRAENIEARYTYLQGRHWLLPVAWIHRWCITMGSFSNHAKQAATILTAEEAEVLRLKKICEDIGL